MGGSTSLFHQPAYHMTCCAEQMATGYINNIENCSAIRSIRAGTPANDMEYLQNTGLCVRSKPKGTCCRIGF